MSNDSRGVPVGHRLLFPEIPDRYWDKIQVDPLKACWTWTGARNDTGYAYIKSKGKMWLAHRFAWVALNGPVPEGLELDHLCGNGRHACVNPFHCEPVTHRENVLRGPNANKTTCRSGRHAWTDENIVVTSAGFRTCVICRRETGRIQDRKRKGRRRADGRRR